uniref:Flocculation protein FLO11-like n=2 Tax=Hirondellea gigas TaxID=1518452 RepID=A0A2P2I309_9CRUS
MVEHIARVRWAAHSQEVSSYVSTITYKDAYSDCFLACKGGVLIPAHRVVLAMASPFLSAVFRSAPSTTLSPIIMLEGIEQDHVEALLQYMYFGFSIVRCDRIPSLCKTAKALGIKEFPTLEVAPPASSKSGDRQDVIIEKIERPPFNFENWSQVMEKNDPLWHQHKRIKLGIKVPQQHLPVLNLNPNSSVHPIRQTMKPSERAAPSAEYHHTPPEFVASEKHSRASRGHEPSPDYHACNTNSHDGARNNGDPRSLLHKMISPVEIKIEGKVGCEQIQAAHYKVNQLTNGDSLSNRNKSTAHCPHSIQNIPLPDGVNPLNISQLSSASNNKNVHAERVATGKVLNRTDRRTQSLDYRSPHNSYRVSVSDPTTASETLLKSYPSKTMRDDGIRSLPMDDVKQSKPNCDGEVFEQCDGDYQQDKQNSVRSSVHHDVRRGYEATISHRNVVSRDFVAVAESTATNLRSPSFDPDAKHDMKRKYQSSVELPPDSESLKRGSHSSLPQQVHKEYPVHFDQRPNSAPTTICVQSAAYDLSKKHTSPNNIDIPFHLKLNRNISNGSTTTDNSVDLSKRVYDNVPVSNKCATSGEYHQDLSSYNNFNTEESKYSENKKIISNGAKHIQKLEQEMPRLESLRKLEYHPRKISIADPDHKQVLPKSGPPALLSMSGAPDLVRIPLPKNADKSIKETPIQKNHLSTLPMVSRSSENNYLNRKSPSQPEHPCPPMNTIPNSFIPNDQNKVNAIINFTNKETEPTQNITAPLKNQNIPFQHKDNKDKLKNEYIPDLRYANISVCTSTAQHYVVAPLPLTITDTYKYEEGAHQSILPSPPSSYESHSPKHENIIKSVNCDECFVIDPLLTKISTTKRRRVRGPKSWEYLLRLLRDPSTNPSLIRWENENEGIFRLVKPDAIALRWGKRTGKHFTDMLTYENFARGLRYHYVTGALSAVSERCFVYKFGPKAGIALDCTATDVSNAASVTINC